MNAYPATSPNAHVPGSGRPHRRRSAFGLPAAFVLVVAVVSILPYSLLIPKVRASGTVQDAVSGQPIAGVRVVTDGAVATTPADGSFDLERVGLAESLLVEADGYQSARVAVFPPRELRVGLAPRTFALTVRDAETGQPVPGATVAAQVARAEPLEPGRFRIGPARQDTLLTIVADGYAQTSVPYRGEADLEARLPRRLAGTVTDARTGRPIPNAFLAVDGGSVVTDRDGVFELKARPTGPVRVLAPGYRRADVDVGAGRSLQIGLEPKVIKGLYLSVYGIADKGLRGNALELAEKTEVNALVIDVKGDRGWISYHSDVPLADKIGANDEHTIPDVGELLATLKQRGIYTIARIVVMKDDKLARNGAQAGLDVAIKDARTGQPWIDGEDLGWVDPFRPEVWEYNIALAREAAQKGFDEVQFDYIRFPTDPSRATSVNAAVYSKELTEENRVEAITEFLRRARDEVRSAGAFLGSDVFGYVTINTSDIGIGQKLQGLAEVVDYICPMV